MNMPNPTLAVVIPVYNEEGILGRVLQEWLDELRRLKINFRIHAFNDGSKDNTLRVINEYAAANPEIIVHNKTNTGHGNTVLSAYRENCDIEWIFQIDADDEIGPGFFRELWEKRTDYDFLICCRVNRKIPLNRKFVTYISKLTVGIFYGSGVADLNCPYRLMRSEKFKEIFRLIPDDTFAPNVIISGMAVLRGYRIFELPVSENPIIMRRSSLRKLRLFKAAFRSFLQTIKFRFKTPSS